MKDLQNDFESFVQNSSQESGSRHILNQVRQQIEKERPLRSQVITKMAIAHSIGTVVTLMSCEQFGLRLFFSGEGLMHYFMQISPTFCMSFCGALYFAISFLCARFILQPEEWLLIMRSRILSISLLALVTLGAFAIFSHEMRPENILLWFLGASLGGEGVSLLRLPHRIKSFRT
ncbi:MAG: hypothetical protein AAGB31_09125 [Bdellovibrio sp.]